MTPHPARFAAHLPLKGKANAPDNLSCTYGVRNATVSADFPNREARDKCIRDCVKSQLKSLENDARIGYNDMTKTARE